ncbi:uncharacterized protein [Drosophila suzukii]|uniref:Reverse transcriptase domain-containing protein n=1 Tax=Drosophila suzukii TaxID=28584 RepID=A0ABM4TNA4_DROSZ
MEELAMKFPYLKGLPITSYANVRPTIIVGADNWNLAVPLRIREGAWRQPIASKTRLGWTLQIPPSKRSNAEGHVNIHEDGRFEIGLLWKSENAALPDSYPNALRRLKCLQRKFIKEPALKIQAQKEIDNLVQKKYARKLSAAEILEEHARPEDAHVQRFLWYDQDDELHHPSVYTMEALTFGINCSPCIAHFIRDRNADRFQQQYPAAAQSVKNYHYVDDFIYSGNDNKEVIEIATQVRHIHAAGGFYIRNWASNSKTVLGELGGGSSSTEVEITTAEKVLGLYWIPETDDLTFIFKFSRLKRDIWTENDAPSKRELLQVLMSMYDPLGLIACYSIELKILLQEVWRTPTDWDDCIPESLLPRWNRWKQALALIATVKIPRCFFKTNEDVQLHTFVDAILKWLQMEPCKFQ